MSNETQAAGSAVQNVELEQVVPSGGGGADSISMLLDIQMPITVVLGKAEVPFRRLLQMAPGAVLELEQEVGQPAELFVQGVRLATGDIVVVNDHYGFRVRQVLGLTPAAEAAKPATAPTGAAKTS